MPDDWKPMATLGTGVFEIRIHTRLEHRVLYIAKYDDAIYVIHAFEKRTAQTPDADVELARRRLSDLRRAKAADKKKRTKEAR